MSSTGQTLAPATSVAGESRLGDYLELTKPRLSLMSVLTAVLGYFAAGPQVDQGVFWCLLIGTSLAAGGAGALNQWAERDADARMRRTANRPVASGRVSPMAAFTYGAGLSLGGVACLALGVNLTASLLAAATVLLYVLAYTPLKKVTPWSTEVGAIPGALPPLIGWVAAGAGFSAMGWVLFAVLFTWQIPHFMAICWNCREDYKAGGFKMLTLVDADGSRTARKAFIWSVLLVGVSFLPLMEGEFGWFLGVSAALLGAYLLRPAWQFWRQASERTATARPLFFATIVYLPLYLSALVVDRFFL
ncbi:MAG: heme o synthase [Verrucomicrobiota bacterium JB022]|nr:heme o synthase [Verrucomicrobiota bacterium JB022]